MVNFFTVSRQFDACTFDILKSIITRIEYISINWMISHGHILFILAYIIHYRLNKEIVAWNCITIYVVESFKNNFKTQKYGSIKTISLYHVNGYKYNIKATEKKRIITIAGSGVVTAVAGQVIS